MIKISKLADYATVILSTMANNIAEVEAVPVISYKTHIPEPTVAKVLKMLAKGGLAVSVRGAGGGYRLRRGASEITVADIVSVIDGPVALTSCVDKDDTSCDHACHCPMRGRWDTVNMAVRAALESVTLADMMDKKYCHSEGLALKNLESDPSTQAFQDDRTGEQT